MSLEATYETEPFLVLYAVRNRDGQYFRAKGYGGSGDTWVDSLQKARIYPKIGPARSQVTFFANNYPKFGIPELVELRVTDVVVLDETARVKKSMDRKAKTEAAAKAYWAKCKLEEAEKQMAEAQATIRRLRK